MHTVDRREDVIIGDCALNLRQRLRCLHACRSLLPDGRVPDVLSPAAGARRADSRLLQSLMFGDEGIMLCVSAVTVRFPHQLQLGPLGEAVIQQINALSQLIAAQSGDHWHSNDERHWRYFSRPAPPGFIIRKDVSVESARVRHPSSSSEHSTQHSPVSGIPHVWLKATSISVTLLDDPWEAWLCAVSWLCCHAFCVCRS